MEPVHEMIVDAYLEAKAAGTLGKHNICRLHLGDREGSHVVAYVLPPSSVVNRWPTMYGTKQEYAFLPAVFLHRTDETSVGGFNETFR